MVRPGIRGTAVLAAGLLLPVVVAQPAHAAAQVSRAEVSGSQLRIEGSASANRTITVDGVSMGSSDGDGDFRIERSGYTSPADCTVDVNDGSPTPAVARLTGCTVVTAPPPPPPPTAATLASISASPTSLEGGGTGSATVTLSAAAPAGGALVALSSSSSVVGVPASVTVPAGATSQRAAFTTTAVSAAVTSTLSATYQGVTRTTSVSVTPPPVVTPPPPPPPPAPGVTLESVALSPSLVQTGTTATEVSLRFSGLTPEGGATVAMASSNTAVATVPPSVTVVAGFSTGAFSAKILSAAVGTTTISATYAGVTRTAVLTVEGEVQSQECGTDPYEPDSTAAPAPLTVGGTTTRAICQAPTPQPRTTSPQDHDVFVFTASGTTAYTVQAVNLGSALVNDAFDRGGLQLGVDRLNSDGTASSVEQNLRPNGDRVITPVLPAGRYRVHAMTSDSQIYPDTNTMDIKTVYGSAGSYGVKLTQSAPPPVITSLRLSTTTVNGGKSLTGTYTLSAPAPPGGMYVDVESSHVYNATPGNTYAPAGATTVSFTISTRASSSDLRVTLTAWARVGASKSAVLTVRR